MDILDTINSPLDLKKLPRSELDRLAKEIRESIVTVVSESGGHLASSLGAVELAIALHYVFDASSDRIIWDVGHQAYAHKLLTGRRDRFHTLRKYGGISGFTRRKESPFDAFSTGHSSTSISAGLGIACAKSLRKEASKVIAVIGDGSMTAGLAYEGLNQAGMHNDKELIVDFGELQSDVIMTLKSAGRHVIQIREKNQIFHIIEDVFRIMGEAYTVNPEFYAAQRAAYQNTRIKFSGLKLVSHNHADTLLTQAPIHDEMINFLDQQGFNVVIIK